MPGQPTGNRQEDYDTLLAIIGRFHDAYQDFDAEPHADEVAELSMWTRELMTYASSLEDRYGFDVTKRLMGRAWQEIKGG